MNKFSFNFWNYNNVHRPIKLPCLHMTENSAQSFQKLIVQVENKIDILMWIDSLLLFFDLNTNRSTIMCKLRKRIYYLLTWHQHNHCNSPQWEKRSRSFYYRFKFQQTNASQENLTARIFGLCFSNSIFFRPQIFLLSSFNRRNWKIIWYTRLFEIYMELEFLWSFKLFFFEFKIWSKKCSRIHFISSNICNIPIIFSKQCQTKIFIVFCFISSKFNAHQSELRIVELVDFQ